MPGYERLFYAPCFDLYLTEPTGKTSSKVLWGIIEVKLVEIPYIYCVNDDFMTFICVRGQNIRYLSPYTPLQQKNGVGRVDYLRIYPDKLKNSCFSNENLLFRGIEHYFFCICPVPPNTPAFPKHLSNLNQLITDSKSTLYFPS